MSKLSDNEIFEKTSFLHGTNSAFIEQMYEKYLENPVSVPGDWQTFFSGIGDTKTEKVSNASWSSYNKIKIKFVNSKKKKKFKWTQQENPSLKTKCTQALLQDRFFSIISRLSQDR